MELNVLVRGQSNALLFAARGGAAALEQGLEARLGVDVHMLYQWGTDTSTIHSGTAFMDWDTDGQQASLLRFVNGLPADIKDNPTATVWMHNESDQGNNGLTTDAWLGEVRADAALVRGALGQDAGTTPYTFVPIRYPYGGNWEAIGDGMEALDADQAFNAEISWAAWSLAMDGDGYPNSGHMGDADAVQLGESLAASMAGTLRPLANGSAPSTGDRGGTAAVDRNLHIDAATYNGAAVSDAAADLMHAGPVGFAFAEGSATDPTSAPVQGQSADIDWDALAAQVMANHNATGSWYL